MKVIGIIAEYNPFHNGHAYQIARIRQETNADYIVVAMSGDFVQRGTPAVIDKYARAKMALSCGADLILELPALWATSSAEYFAMAGVTLLEKMGCVDSICFGAETDDLPLLTEIAAFLIKEPQKYRDSLSAYLKSGLSFPVARAKAVCNFFETQHTSESIAAVMSEPNNILAIEYLKAIQKRNSSLTPYLIRRSGAGYHEKDIRMYTGFDENHTESPVASATAIRNVLERRAATSYGSSTDTCDDTKLLSELTSAMPIDAHTILAEYLQSNSIVSADAFSSILGYLFLTQTKEYFSHIADCNEEIANRLVKNRCLFSSFSAFCTLNKSRDITYTRISRILMHLLLGIMDTDYMVGKAQDFIPYLRILGFRTASAPLLRTLKLTASVPVISKLADAPDYLSDDALAILKKDILAADLYEQILTQCSQKKTTPRSEYTREIVLL